MKLDILVDVHDTVGRHLLTEVAPQRIGRQECLDLGQHELEDGQTAAESLACQQLALVHQIDLLLVAKLLYDLDDLHRRELLLHLFHLHLEVFFLYKENVSNQHVCQQVNTKSVLFELPLQNGFGSQFK